MTNFPLILFIVNSQQQISKFASGECGNFPVQMKSFRFKTEIIPSIKRNDRVRDTVLNSPPVHPPVRSPNVLLVQINGLCHVLDMGKLRRRFQNWSRNRRLKWDATDGVVSCN